MVAVGRILYHMVETVLVYTHITLLSFEIDVRARRRRIKRLTVAEQLNVRGAPGNGAGDEIHALRFVTVIDAV